MILIDFFDPSPTTLKLIEPNWLWKRFGNQDRLEMFPNWMRFIVSSWGLYYRFSFILICYYRGFTSMQPTRARSPPQRGPVDAANQRLAPSVLAPARSLFFSPSPPSRFSCLTFPNPILPASLSTHSPSSVGNMTKWKGAGWVGERERRCGERKLVILWRRTAVSEQISLCSAFHKARL